MTLTLLMRKPKDTTSSQGAAPHFMIARAGSAGACLPVSTFPLAVPDSPTHVSSFGSTSSSPTSPSPSVASGGHIVAQRSAFEEVTLSESKDAGDRAEQRGSLLNKKLSSLLERRKAKEEEALKTAADGHAADLKRREAVHREELNMKDTAHRRIVEHMEGELNDLRSQLENALSRWEAATESADSLAKELDIERKLRRASEEEQRGLHRLLEAELEGI